MNRRRFLGGTVVAAGVVLGVGCGNSGTPDTGSTPDTGATDTGSATDTGIATDTGTMTDTGTVTDTGTETDSDLAADTGSTPDTGATLDAGPRRDSGMRDSAAPADVPSACTDVIERIGTNHGHVLQVPPADVATGTARTYRIMGTSGHDHTVMVTPAQFTMLRTGATVTITSGVGGGHTHAVMITCG